MYIALLVDTAKIQQLRAKPFGIGHNDFKIWPLPVKMELLIQEIELLKQKSCFLIWKERKKITHSKCNYLQGLKPIYSI